MNEPTEEQEGKLWRWCGLVPVWGGYGEVAHVNFEEDEPVELDLNNLFKVAVSKLLKRHTVEMTIMETHVRVCIYFDFDGNRTMIIETHQDPALALFWAIWGVIKEGK